MRDGGEVAGAVVYPFFPEQRRVAHQLSLVLVHGWGLEAVVWRELAALLQPYFHIVAVDLPGYGRARHRHPASLRVLAQELLPVLPRRALYLGWSFGALLCLELALRHAARVRGVVALTASPCFRAREDWPGALSEDSFAQLRRAVEAHPAAALRQFLGLLLQGETASRRVLRALHNALPQDPCKTALLEGLAQLEASDLRDPLRRVSRPCRFLLAEHDVIAPAAQGAQLAALAGNVSWELLPRSGHAPLLSQPRSVARAVLRFSEQHLWRTAGAPQPFTRRQIAVSFGRAAAHYDGAAQLQRRVGESLLRQAEQRSQAGQAEQAAPGNAACVLDVGCGTGYFLRALRRRYPRARLLALDMAPQMVRRATTRRVAASGLCADGNALPLGAEVADVVFVNLVLQWCDQPERLLGELYRVLRPGGRALVSTFVYGTLWELRAAWRAVDDAEHINPFPTAPALEEVARSSGFLIHSGTETVLRRYRGLRSLMHELRRLGAGVVRRSHTPGAALPSFRRLRRAEAALRDERGLLPVSWQLLYLVLERPRG